MNFFLTACLCVLAGLPLKAAEYYLDPSGGTLSNPGTRSEPWPSLEAVMDANKTFAAGDELILMGGYHGKPTVRGHNVSPVIIRPDEEAEPQLGRITVSSASQWIIRGLLISPSFAPEFQRQTMVALQSSASDIVVEQCRLMTIEDASSWTASDWDTKACNGISASGPNLVVRSNHLLNVNFGISVTGISNRVDGNLIENFSGDGLRGLGDYGVFENNFVKNCYDVNSNHDDGFQSWSVGEQGVGTGVVRGIVLRGNTILNHEQPDHPLAGTLQGIGCFDGFFEDWVVENNVIITDHWHGITLSGARNCRILHNTVVDLNQVRPGPPWIRIGPHKNGTPSSDNVIRNNLTTDLNVESGSATVDHNLEISDYSLHFRDYANRDLRLIESSPAIDAGQVEEDVTKDKAGLPRVLDGDGDGEALPDLGAYEFTHGSVDSDADGMTDPHEAIAGTDLTDAGDLLKVISDHGEGMVVLSWNGRIGRRYVVKSKPDVSGSEWTEIPGSEFLGAGMDIHFTNPISPAHGFFSVEVAELFPR